VNDERCQVGLRLSPELKARLDAAADERDLSVNFLATRAIEDFLERLLPVEEVKWAR
jgi:predicted transcriptional regulator